MAVPSMNRPLKYEVSSTIPIVGILAHLVGYIAVQYCLQIHYRVQQLKGLWPLGSRFIFIQGFLKDDILACVET
jgi:hypothetical protein